MERLSAPFALTSAESDTLCGMASVFGGMIDAYVPTRILPGAFTKTLLENRRRIKALWQHEDHHPIGIPTVLEERTDGLYVELKISQTTLGKDALILAKDGVITEFSIGFDPIKHVMVNETDIGPVRHLQEVRLWEVSPVTFAADKAATITSIHALIDSALSASDKASLEQAIATLQARLKTAEPAADTRALTAETAHRLRELEVAFLSMSVH